MIVVHVTKGLLKKSFGYPFISQLSQAFSVVKSCNSEFVLQYHVLAVIWRTVVLKSCNSKIVDSCLFCDTVKSVRCGDV